MGVNSEAFRKRAKFHRIFISMIID